MSAAGSRLLGVVGWKNNGKTTLVERMVAGLVARGYSVSTIKHAHHAFDLDQPGKDSYRHRAAGAREVAIASRARYAVLGEVGADASEPTLDDLLARLRPVDVVVVEGYKRHPHPKIEVHRAAADRGLIAPEDPTIIAVAADGPVRVDRPVFALDDVDAILDFGLRAIGLAPRAAAASARRGTPVGGSAS